MYSTPNSRNWRGLKSLATLMRSRWLCWPSLCKRLLQGRQGQGIRDSSFGFQRLFRDIFSYSKISQNHRFWRNIKYNIDIMIYMYTFIWHYENEPYNEYTCCFDRFCLTRPFIYTASCVSEVPPRGECTLENHSSMVFFWRNPINYIGIIFNLSRFMNTVFLPDQYEHSLGYMRSIP